MFQPASESVPFPAQQLSHELTFKISIYHRRCDTFDLVSLDLLCTYLQMRMVHTLRLP